MKSDILKQLITIIINFVGTGALGYLVASLKNIKKKHKEKEDKILEKIEQLEERQKQAEEEQLLQMKSDLTNKFYVYNEMDEVEDYLVMSFRGECERYFNKFNA